MLSRFVLLLATVAVLVHAQTRDANGVFHLTSCTSNHSAVFYYSNGIPTNTSKPAASYVFDQRVNYSKKAQLAQIYGENVEIVINGNAFNHTVKAGAIVGELLYQDIPSCPATGYDKFYCTKLLPHTFKAEGNSTLGRCSGSIYCLRGVSCRRRENFEDITNL